jgi:hypothetical protein
MRVWPARTSTKYDLIYAHISFLALNVETSRFCRVLCICHSATFSSCIKTGPGWNVLGCINPQRCVRTCVL